MTGGQLNILDDALNRRKGLWEDQGGKCFLCENDIVLDKGKLEIAMIVPPGQGGREQPDNYALLHASCYRARQSNNLRAAKAILHYFMIREISRKKGASQNRPNLSDVLGEFGGAKHELKLQLDQETVKIDFGDAGKQKIETPLYRDDLSGLNYFFAKIPIEYLFHDEEINPRGIGGYINKLIEEFAQQRPQLNVGLAWVKLRGKSGKTKIFVFDGQHKAAAQVLLGVREIPVRVFVNPDLELLLTTNTNAATVLRQIAFDKSVERSLGSNMYLQRINRYRQATGRKSDDFSFSEKELAAFFRGESKQVQKNIIDEVKNSITHSADNKLKEYIDFGGRKNEKPFSYPVIEKTFYSMFINQKLLEMPLDYKMEEGENPRQLEKEQLVKLMNIVAEEIYEGKFDPELGASGIEERVSRGEEIPDEHLCSCRMSRDDVLQSWLKILKKVIVRHFANEGIEIDEEALFQQKLPPEVWENITRVVKNISKLPLWVNRDLPSTAFKAILNISFGLF